MSLNYSQVFELENILSQQDRRHLTQDDPKSNSPDDSILESALVRAEGVVDSYLAKKYQVPLPAAPPEVFAAVLSLAKYFLFERKPMMPEAVAASYKNTIAWLKDVATGKAEINAPAGSTIMVSNTARRGFASKKHVGFSKNHW